MCKNTMKLVVLVLDSYTPNSIRNSAIQKQTWVQDFEDSCDVLFYKAGKENKKLGYDLILDCSDTYSAMGVKTIKAFEWVNSNLDYDYIFRTNTSSYVDFRNLMKYLSKISKEETHYSGYIGKFDGIDYVSGSGIILSKLAIKSILKSKNQLDESVVEDVAIGKLLKLNKILPKEGKRKDIESHKDISSIHSDEYHIRCRLDPFGYSRNLEKYLINYFYMTFNSKNLFLEIIFSNAMKIDKAFLKFKKFLKFKLFTKI